MKKKNIKIFFNGLLANINENVAGIYGLKDGQEVSGKAYYKLVSENCTSIAGKIKIANDLRDAETRN